MQIQDLSIDQIQEAIMENGWRFHEVTNHDGTTKIEFSRSANPNCFDISSDDYDVHLRGWGTYPRQEAWEMAYESLMGKDQVEQALDVVEVEA